MEEDGRYLDADVVRKQVAGFRRNLSQEEIEARSRQVMERLSGHIQRRRDAIVLCYYPLRGEVDLRPLYARMLEEGQQLYFPKTTREEMRFFEVTSLSEFTRGNFSVYEPTEDSEERELFLAQARRGAASILCLTPGIAFSRDLHRIGFGKGYYDRFFAAFSTTLPETKLYKIGVCFREQLYAITPKPHDVPMEMLVTQDGVLYGHVER